MTYYYQKTSIYIIQTRYYILIIMEMSILSYGCCRGEVYWEYIRGLLSRLQQEYFLFYCKKCRTVVKNVSYLNGFGKKVFAPTNNA